MADLDENAGSIDIVAGDYDCAYAALLRRSPAIAAISNESKSMADALRKVLDGFRVYAKVKGRDVGSLRPRIDARGASLVVTLE